MRLVAIASRIMTFESATPLHDARSTLSRRHTVLVRAESQDGHVGWGEAAAFAGSHELVSEAVAHLAPIASAETRGPRELGRALLRATAHYGQRGAVVSAISGIETAAWDLLGHRAGLGLSTLLGGMSRPVRWYGTSGFYHSTSKSDPLSVLRDDIQTALALDPAGLKIKIGRFGVGDAIRRAETAREQLGADRLLILDANNAFTVAEAARVMNGVADLDVAFFEEPIAFGNPAASAELRARGVVPVAGYELEPTFDGCSRYVAARAVDVIQPDVSWSGGVAETLEVAHLARRHDISCVPHNFGSIVATAANYHVVSVAGGDLLELDRSGSPFSDPTSLAAMGWKLADGVIQAPELPGLGLSDIAEWADDL